MKILLAVDGSDYSVRAAKYVAAHFAAFQGAPDVTLLYVKLPIPAGLALMQAQNIVGDNAVERYYREEAEAALAPTQEIMRQKNIPFQSDYRIGEIAKEIDAYASKNNIDMIVMGSHGHGALTNLVLGSVASKVLAASKVPVLIVR